MSGDLDTAVTEDEVTRVGTHLEGAYHRIDLNALHQPGYAVEGGHYLRTVTIRADNRSQDRVRTAPGSPFPSCRSLSGG